MKHSEIWSSDNLKSLISTTSVVISSLSESTGVPVPTIQSYLRGRSTPSIDKLIAFADFFNVPLDFLCGRYSLEDSREFIKNYGENFMKLRRTDYEKYLIHTRHSHLPESRHVELPWPYNLLKAVTHEDWNDIYTEDQMNGLNKAINSLHERDQRVIRMYFEQGMKLEDVGAAEGVTGSRAREIAVRAIKRLSHPNNCIYIIKGVQGAELESRYSKFIAKLEEDKNKAEADYEQYINAISKKKELVQEILASSGSDRECYELIENDGYPSWYSTIYTLDLSNRCRNCLARAGIRTMEDIVKSAKSEKLEKVPGLGKKSLRELMSKVNPKFLK